MRSSSCWRICAECTRSNSGRSSSRLNDVNCMPAEITVGTPLLTINEGTTFMVTDLDGQISADSELGVFANDTRYVSYYAISADGNPWRRLSSAATTHYSSRAYLISDGFSTEVDSIPNGRVGLIVTRTLTAGIYGYLDVINYGI